MLIANGKKKIECWSEKDCWCRLKEIFDEGHITGIYTIFSVTLVYLGLILTMLPRTF